jgi:hypothetical protein
MKGIYMKVYIGPYKTWYGPYQIVDIIFFWVDRKGIFPDDDPLWNRWDYRLSEWLGNKLSDTWFNDICLWFNEKRKRKISIRIDEYDTWSMDHTLSYIIHPMLIQLKETKHGSGHVDDEDVPEELRSTSAPEMTDEEKQYGHTDAFWHKRWDWVLDEMIYAHASQFNDWEDEYYDRKDFDGMREIEKRIANGYRLFGKYYKGLWD